MTKSVARNRALRRQRLVEHEVETALAREQEQKRTMLFPIRLDDAFGWIDDISYRGWI